MKNKHTKGPWKYEKATPSPNNHPKDRFEILTYTPDCYDNNYGVNTGGRYRSIGSVRVWANIAQAEANARLIAAAPDLVEAIQYALDWYELPAGAQDLLQMAVTKATGGNE
jgi:hypothetical protein